MVLKLRVTRFYNLMISESVNIPLPSSTETDKVNKTRPVLIKYLFI